MTLGDTALDEAADTPLVTPEDAMASASIPAWLLVVLAAGVWFFCIVQMPV